MLKLQATAVSVEQRTCDRDAGGSRALQLLLLLLMLHE